MIICPALKGSLSKQSDSNEKIGAQGAVSWQTCLKCDSNKGSNEEEATIQCGLDSGNEVTIESIPLE